MNDEDLNAFVHAMRTLEPYRNQLVIVGGWAHQLYPRHPWAAQPGFEPLRTQDLDVALPLTPRKRADNDLSVLLDGSGYVVSLKDIEERPPVSEYRRAGDTSGFSLEFLAPLLGASTDRTGKAKITKSILGVSAQTLRHIDLLLDAPWEVELVGSVPVKKGQEVMRVQIANPVTFIVQKLLIHSERSDRRKQAKDVLYIHDTLLMFGGQAEFLHSPWKRCHDRLSDKPRRHVQEIRRKLTATTHDLHRRAFEIARRAGRVDISSADDLRGTLSAGLSALME